MNKIIENAYITISRLSPEQAKSADGKHRLSIQGVFQVEPSCGDVPEIRHEFSALRPDRDDIVPGKYFLFGKMAVDIAEEPFREHEANAALRYVKHAATIKFVAGDIAPVESAPF